MALTRCYCGRRVWACSGRRLFASQPLDEDYEKYVLEVKERMLQPRFTGVPSFFRLPHDNLISPSNHMDTLNNALESDVDIGLVGVPYDGGVTNRPGARYGSLIVSLLVNVSLPINQTTVTTQVPASLEAKRRWCGWSAKQLESVHFYPVVSKWVTLATL